MSVGNTTLIGISTLTSEINFYSESSPAPFLSMSSDASRSTPGAA